jgi:hypothetical protein
MRKNDGCVDERMISTNEKGVNNMKGGGSEKIKRRETVYKESSRPAPKSRNK